MRFSVIGYIVGALAVCFGASMAFSVGWGIYFQEYQPVLHLLEAMGISIGLGLVAIVLLRRRPRVVGPREGFAVAAVGWAVLAGLGALPFWLGGYIPSYLDCYFETMSGLTTTGASILTCQGGALPTDIEALPHCMLFWRSFTHWLGGMGIIVLSLALLPMLGVGGMQMYRAEVPGPTADKLVPRVRQTAKLLWALYVLLSAAECLLLWAHPRVTLFDAMCHTFGTMATGGFSTHSTSVGYFNSPYVDIVVIVFMLLAGANFALHYAGLRGKLTAYPRNSEFRFYFGVVVVATTVVALLVAVSQTLPIGESVRQSAFQVVSILTTTGYTTANYDLWPILARLGLLVLMFVGGCAGSTGGGMKNIRVLLLIKHAGVEMRRLVHPQAVIPVRVGGRPIGERVVQSVQAFVILYIGIFVIASLLLAGMLYAHAPDLETSTDMASDNALVTSFSAVAATLNNIGPGLTGVGPGEWKAYSWMPPEAKALLTLCMLVGRLEVFTVVLLFTPWIYR
jgi:trk system potassium uptake protein TrkH